MGKFEYKSMYNKDNKMTKEMRWRRFKGHYSDLFPLKEGKKEKKDLIKKSLKDVEFKENNIIIFCEDDLLKPVMVYGFLKLNKFVSYDFVSFYEVVENFFNDEKSDLGDINANYLILYSGVYGEIRNEMLPELICQIIERYAIQNKYIWIYYRGKKGQFRRKYSDVYKLIDNRGFDEIEIKENKKDNKYKY